MGPVGAIAGSYTSRVVTNGLKAQINNPELKVRALDPHIRTLIDKLQHFNQLESDKTNLKSERWASRESGSGGGRSEEMESSGDCDDEDGCQGSGEKSRTTDDLRANSGDRNESSATVKKADSTDTIIVKLKENRGNQVMDNRVSTTLLFTITALAVLWHSLL
ncbi:PREDICTED: glypican-5-like [Gekko japonicus]|uniref:Glypican-5-like n=1 Tax=Gekko japonicus TaxID=146911 RepID=A0ABM1KIU4_GEKJA|nr:PREDICTED: glypican-5-like [Gekko japonicus]